MEPVYVRLPLGLHGEGNSTGDVDSIAQVEVDVRLAAADRQGAKENQDEDVCIERLLREEGSGGCDPSIDDIPLGPKVGFRAFEMVSQCLERVGRAVHRLAVSRTRVSQLGSSHSPTIVTGVPTLSFAKMRSR